MQAGRLRSNDGVLKAETTPATMTLKGFDAVDTGTMKLTIDGIDVTVDKNVSDTEELASLINSTLSAAGSDITATLNDDKTEITLTGPADGSQFKFNADTSKATGVKLTADTRHTPGARAACPLLAVRRQPGAAKNRMMSLARRFF